MARKELKAPKPKKQRFSGRAVTVAQIKLGGEPTLSLSPSSMELTKAFNWYNQCVERDKRSQFLTDYMKEEGCFSPEQILFVEKKGVKFPATWAYIARMFSRGAQLDEETKCRLHAEFSKFFERANQVEYDEDGNPVEQVRKIVRRPIAAQAVVDAINRIELEIEETQRGKGNPDINWYEELLRLGVTSKDAKEVHAYFERQFLEYLALYSGKMEDLNEGYSHLKKIYIQRVAVLVYGLTKDLASLIAAKKEKVRKTRRRKAIPVEKQIGRLRFLKESPQYKISSVDPTKIVGAKALVTFNAVNRMLTFFEAKDDKGIQVKGINLLNVNSRVKKLRKPEDVLPLMTSGTKASVNMNFEKIRTTEYQSNNKPTTDTILLRVFS
jgi:hypothetical protein